MKSDFDVIMVWYQNDWGLYGRRNEFIARMLLKHKAVRKVLHIEPPVYLENIRIQLYSESIDDNLHTNLSRINLCNENGVLLYTPYNIKGISDIKRSKHLQNQINKVIDLCGMDNIILWLYPPHPFAEFMMNILKDRTELIVSDCVDDHRQYAKTIVEKNLIGKHYENMARASDVVFSVSKIMRNEMANYNSRSFYIPNAIPSNLFNNRKQEQVPDDMAHIKHPIIGYTGSLLFRIDAELIKFIAKKNPKWNIVLIGTSPNDEVRALFELPNVHWLGPIRYESIHEHLSNFDVCILPHMVNSMTDNMNPLKIYEYLALGKPVISTDVAGVRIFQPDIEIARDNDAFVSAIERVLREDSLRRRRKRIDRVRNHTWSDRVDEMMQLCINTLRIKTSISNKTISRPYHLLNNQEILSCIPATAKVILDIGCASGSLGEALKKEHECFIIGMEDDPELANMAKDILDDVLIGDIENNIDNLPSNYFDCIIIGDVLERLPSSDSFLKKLSRPLKQNGKIVAVIPNIRHWSVIKALLEGNWNYEDTGITDRPTLRFFTKKSILNMFANTGYTIKEIKPTNIGSNNILMQIISQALSATGVDTTALTEESDCYQYIVTAEKVIQAPKLTSIIILTYNQLKFTKMCLESIQEYTPEPHEIIFVDNGSTDGTKEYLQSFTRDHKDTQLIINDHNLGFAAGNNQALKKANGDYILLLNNDVVVTEGWLSGLIRHITKTPEIGMVGPMSNAVSGPQLVDNASYEKTMKAMHIFANELAARNHDKTTKILRLVGFCLLIRKEVIDIIGGLDENYSSGNYEDDDLCLRSCIAGFYNIIAHDVFIHHYGSMTFKGNAIDYQTTMECNRQYFADKWKDIVEVNGDVYKVNLTRKERLKKLLEWGEDNYSKGNLHAAVKIFERVLKLDNANSQAMNNLGVIQWQLSREPASAMKTFQAALRLNPKDSNALENLLQAATESSRFDLINPALLKTVEKAQPANPDLVTLINAQQNLAINA